MAIDGMDLDAIQPAIQSINNALSELNTLMGSTQTAFAAIESSWVGSDANQFKGNWPSFSSALTSAHSQLSTLATHLQSNYQMQQTATSDY